METRTPQGAIAWFFALNTVPYIAVPFYWILGRSKFRGYKLVRSRVFRANDPTAREAQEELRRADLIAGPDRRDPALLERLAPGRSLSATRPALTDGTTKFRFDLQGGKLDMTSRQLHFRRRVGQRIKRRCWPRRQRARYFLYRDRSISCPVLAEFRRGWVESRVEPSGG